jgi:hypothetical protein
MRFKIKNKIKLVCITLGVFLTCGQSVALAGADDFFHSNVRLDPRYIWGAETNGFRAGIYCGGIGIVVEIHRDLDVTGIPNAMNKAPEEPPPFLMSTNWVAGPMELIDTNGNKLPLLDSHILDTNSYPDTLSWQTILYNRHRQRYWSGPEDGNCNIFNFVKTNWTEDSMIFLEYNQIYKTDNHGEYKFTIWPKLYQRSSTNEDIYHRIDLPPVTVPIKI